MGFSDSLRAAGFGLFVQGANFLLKLPGHSLRIFVLRRLCGCSVGRGTSVERGVRITTRGGVRIGDFCNINRGVLLDGAGTLTIGDRVNISPEVMLLTADHDPDSPTFAGRYRGVVVGSRTWLATRAIVLPGTTVHEGAVVAAGAVVGGTVPGSSVIAGVPGAKIRSRSSDAQSWLPTYRRWFH
jgi:acetyltransferase-like isoleucine patch superfamily enzyme